MIIILIIILILLLNNNKLEKFIVLPLLNLGTRRTRNMVYDIRGAPFIPIKKFLWNNPEVISIRNKPLY